jgi:hypothetical protein
MQVRQPARWRNGALALIAIIFTLVLAADASAATVRIGITGSLIVAPNAQGDPAIGIALTGVSGNFTNGLNATGTVTQTYPSPPPNATVSVFHGDVSQGCVRVQGNRAVVVGHLPASEQYDVPNFGHIEWAGAFLEDNGVAGASPLDRGTAVQFRTTSGQNACNPTNTGIWTTVANTLGPLNSGDSTFTYTDQLDAYPSNPDTAFWVVDNANGLSVTLSDASDPAGLNVAVGAGGAGSFVRFDACGFKVKVNAGGTTIFTCASLITEVVSGSAEIELPDDTVVTLTAGAVVEVSDNADGGVTIDNIGSVAVTVTVDGVSQSLAPGETASSWDFQGSSLRSTTRRC